MYSKYILNSNWKSLSSNYEYDDEITFKNQKVYVDGNIDINYSPFLSLAKDYTNNNFSMLFLTEKQEINKYLEFKQIDNTVNTQTSFLASNFKDKKIIDDTAFLSLSANLYVFKEIKDLNEACFLEYKFLNENDFLLYRVEKDVYFYFSIDPLTESIFCLSSYKAPDSFSLYDLEKIKLNYSYYNNNENITIYRYFQGAFLFFKNNFNVLKLDKLSREDTSDKTMFFSLLSVKNLPDISLSTNWISYKRGINMDNLSVDTSRSLYNLKNNFIFHYEYARTQADRCNFNTLTLKNELSYKDEAIRDLKSKNSLRSYTSIFAGGKRELGYNNLSIGYTSNYTTYNFIADKTTWFHLPNVEKKITININDSNFFQNGAIAGKAPIFSDKIWKKNANYPGTSNYGESTSKENTGQWLCAWLSGGSDDAIWINRYYNPEYFTPFEALSYSPNVEYRPQYYNKYSLGIKDIPSDITLETGGWYAYSRLGKQTASSIIKSLEDKLIYKDLSIFKDNVDNDVFYKIDRQGNKIYDFNNKEYGILPISGYKDNYNNFTLSFFASRYDWNVDREYQILGNYLNEGFGFFNSEDINPVLYYLKDEKTKIVFNNNKVESFLEIDISRYLPYELSTIAGVFYKNILDNFFIITANGYVLEFTANGTLVEKLTAFNVESDSGDSVIYGCCNNNNKGILFLSNNTNIEIDLISKKVSNIQAVAFVNAGLNDERNVVIDNNNRVYNLNGSSPVIKGESIYFLNNLSGSIDFFDKNENTVTTFLSGFREQVVDFNFDMDGNTYVLYNSGFDVYNALGIFEKTQIVSIKNKPLSAVNIGFSKLDGITNCFVLLKGEGESFFFNITENFYKKVYTDFSILQKNYDFCFDRLMQNTIRNTKQSPLYKIKLKLSNFVNVEDFILLETVILAEGLGTGEHHFAISLDTVKGIYQVYIDNKVYSTKTFTPGKYSYSNILKNNLMIGITPFYGNIPYNNFYKTPYTNFYTSDLTIKKLKFFNKAFNEDEVKMLFFEQYFPSNLSTTIRTGDRSFIDTVSRVFKNKMPGKKSNLINLSISNTNISDKNIQQMYNNLILKEVRDVLPGYVKINKIEWKDNKIGSEKMLDGYFNNKNTLTEN